MIPILKAGKDDTNPTNYPIVLTSYTSKTMERMIIMLDLKCFARKLSSIIST